jgi:uroporphyrinogen decarboxylase
MNIMNTLFHQTCLNKQHLEKPIWMMRQAGRYLPEYRNVRKSFKDFIEFCLTPDAVCEVTLQPIVRFNFDAAIIFSDILILPHLLEQAVSFEDGYGPKLREMPHHLLSGAPHDVDWTTIENVYKALKVVRNELAATKSLIGFCGMPWTLMCYMIHQKKIGDGVELKGSLKRFPKKEILLNLLIEVVAQHAINQINAGCDVIQLFDSWAIFCEEPSIYLFLPLQAILKKIWDVHPHCPIIYYGRGISHYYNTISDIDGNLVFGVDESSDLTLLKELKRPLQGNLDPLTLIAGGDALEGSVRRILDQTKGVSHIFNLGHGIKPETPIANVEKMIGIIRES